MKKLLATTTMIFAASELGAARPVTFASHLPASVTGAVQVVAPNPLASPGAPQILMPWPDPKSGKTPVSILMPWPDPKSGKTPIS